MKNIILKNGIISGLFLAGFLTFSMYLMKGKTDFNTGGAEMFGYLSMLVALGFAMFFGINKNNESIPSPTLGKNMLLCIGIAAVASLFYLVAWALLYKYMVPDFVVKMLANYDHNYSEGRITLEELNDAKAMFDGYDNPIYFSLVTLMEIFPLGVLMSLVLPSLLWFMPKKTRD